MGPMSFHIYCLTADQLSRSNITSHFPHRPEQTEGSNHFLLLAANLNVYSVTGINEKHFAQVTSEHISKLQLLSKKSIIKWQFFQNIVNNLYNSDTSVKDKTLEVDL